MLNSCLVGDRGRGDPDFVREMLPEAHLTGLVERAGQGSVAAGLAKQSCEILGSSAAFGVLADRWHAIALPQP